MNQGADDAMDLIPSQFRYSLGPSPPRPSVRCSLYLAHEHELERQQARRRKSEAKARRVSLGLSLRMSTGSRRASLSLLSSASPALHRGSRVRDSGSLSSALGALSFGPSDVEAAEAMEAQQLQQLGPARRDEGRWGLGARLTAACLEYLPLPELTEGSSAVCRDWAVAALQAHAAALAHLGRPRPEVSADLSRLASDFPVGQFLSDGAYKNVFRVWSARAARVEAVSVMDIGAIAAMGNEAIVAQELRVSILMSALVRQRICPNHVQTFGVLRTGHDPKDLWSCSDQDFLMRRAAGARKGPRAKAQGPTGDYQLIRMELCRHGDLESYLRRQPDGLVPEATARDMLFQMCFSLYAAREAHLMRHYGAWVEAVQAPSP
jgi:hypothetical protein